MSNARVPQIMALWSFSFEDVKDSDFETFLQVLSSFSSFIPSLIYTFPFLDCQITCESRRVCFRSSTTKNSGLPPPFFPSFFSPFLSSFLPFGLFLAIGRDGCLSCMFEKSCQMGSFKQKKEFFFCFFFSYVGSLLTLFLFNRIDQRALPINPTFSSSSKTYEENRYSD